jgi:hypothetical protein
MQAFAFEPVLSELRHSVYPSVDGYWRADAAISGYLDNSLPNPPEDSFSCGPAALAAFFGDSEVTAATADFDIPWMNRKTMESCLNSLGAKYRKHQGQLPPQGLVLLQRITRPEKRSYRGSFLTDTHWIAVIDDYVFDVNWPQWLPCRHWKSLVGDPLSKMHGSESWRVVTGYEILTGSGSGQQEGFHRPTVGIQSMFAE